MEDKDINLKLVEVIMIKAIIIALCMLPFVVL